MFSLGATASGLESAEAACSLAAEFVMGIACILHMLLRHVEAVQTIDLPALMHYISKVPSTRAVIHLNAFAVGASLIPPLPWINLCLQMLSIALEKSFVSNSFERSPAHYAILFLVEVTGHMEDVGEEKVRTTRFVDLSSVLRPIRLQYTGSWDVFRNQGRHMVECYHYLLSLRTGDGTDQRKWHHLSRNIFLTQIPQRS